MFDLFGVFVVEDERPTGKIPVKNIILVMTSGAVSVQVNADGGWVFPEATVALRSIRIALRVVDQVAADEAAPIRLPEGNIQCSPIDRHLHGIEDVVVVDYVVLGKRNLGVLAPGDTDAKIGSVMNQVVRQQPLLGWRT